MGRLFWKFFFFVWLAQLTTIFGVSTVFWLERQQDHQRFAALHPEGEPPPPEFRRGPGGPGDFRPPPREDGIAPPPPPGRHRPHYPRMPWVPLVTALMGSLVFAALLAWYFAKPIRKLRSAFDDAAAGRLDTRLGDAMGGRRDELADLGRDFDRMADQLEHLVDGQRRLLHDASHELRSPLARLQAAIDIARQQPAKAADSLDRIERESRRMDGLVGELLTLSRLEAGVAGPAEEIDMAELLNSLVDDASFEAQAKGVRVTVAGRADGLVDGDGELLHRAIENVVRNAVKYAPADSEVRVEAEVDGAHSLHIAVSDAGPGVPEADLEAIFEPFCRGSQPKDSNGHGLGLAIARRLIVAMGGSIAATNRAEGGLRVDIVLPVKPLA